MHNVQSILSLDDSMIKLWSSLVVAGLATSTIESPVPKFQWLQLGGLKGTHSIVSKVSVITWLDCSSKTTTTTTALFILGGKIKHTWWHKNYASQVLVKNKNNL